MCMFGTLSRNLNNIPGPSLQVANRYTWYLNFVANVCSASCMQIYGVTALAWASHEGHEQVVDVLLKAGANPHIQDKVIISVPWYYKDYLVFNY